MLHMKLHVNNNHVLYTCSALFTGPKCYCIIIVTKGENNGRSRPINSRSFR